MSPGDTHGLLDGRSLCLLHILVGARYRTLLWDRMLDQAAYCSLQLVRKQFLTDRKTGFLFGRSKKDSRRKKLKTQEKNLKLKLKTRKVGIYL